MTTATTDESTTSSTDAIEPIHVVLARLAGVRAATVSLRGCDRWLADAARVLGWLAVARVEVEAARQELWWQHQFGPFPTDPRHDDVPAGDDSRVADADPASGHDADAGPAPGPGEDPEAEPDPPPARPTSARERARAAKLARVLGWFPAFRSLLERGTVTEDHVLALDTVRNRRDAQDREGDLTAAAVAHSAEGFVNWLLLFDAEIDLARGADVAARHHARRALHLFDRTGEMGELRGVLPPAVFDAFRRTLEAIDAELRRRSDGDRSASYPQRMADALVELMHRANAGDHGEGSLRTAVVVLIDLADLLAGTGHGTSVDGSPIDVGEVRRMAAREHVIPLVLGADSEPLDLGRAQRYATDHQWLALLARDGGCALCDAPLGPLDAHHTPAWHDGGRTDLDAMCLLCRRCHRRVHAERLAVRLRGGTVDATTADGAPVPTRRRRRRPLPPD
jgi:hypothetical protein